MAARYTSWRRPEADVVGSLEALVEALGATGADVALQEPARPSPADGTAHRRGGMPDHRRRRCPRERSCPTSRSPPGTTLPVQTAGAPRHDWLTLTGGAIGQGLPVAVGAAVACPDRPVLALQADGSAMYTIQALWTMAREQLDVTVVIFNNRSYSILNVELARVRRQWRRAQGQRPARPQRSGHGLHPIGHRHGSAGAVAWTPARSWRRPSSEAVADPGPHLIEVVVSPVFSARQLRAMPYALRALGFLPRARWPRPSSAA